MRYFIGEKNYELLKQSMIEQCDDLSSLDKVVVVEDLETPKKGKRMSDSIFNSKVHERVFNWSDQELGTPLTDLQTDDMLQAIGYFDIQEAISSLVEGFECIMDSATCESALEIANESLIDYRKIMEKTK